MKPFEVAVEIFKTVINRLEDTRIRRELQSPDSREALEKLYSIGHPAFILLLGKQVLLEDSKSPIVVNQGAIEARVHQFIADTDFNVKSTAHQSIQTTIHSGDHFLVPHILLQGEQYAGMSPFKRMAMIKRDLIALAYRYTDSQLAPSIRDPLLVGATHLAPFFSQLEKRSQGLQLVWSIQDLPKILREQYAHDSQTSSDMFGGTRTVLESDVGFVCVRASTLINLLNNNRA